MAEAPSEKPFHILVVDADVDAQVLFHQKFREAMKASKYVFTFAHEGVQALEHLNSSEYLVDLVLTDINIPGVSGLELMQHADQKSEGCKSILVTSYGDTDNIRLAMNRGAYDFCTKPIDFEDLERTMDRALQTLKQQRVSQKNQDDLKGIQQELAVSSKLQQSILPKAFSGHASIELYAKMTAAKDIGGDFYDFFWLDDHRLGFAIADVSGKNISAALYMAITRTLVKSMAHLTPEPHTCLIKANQALCQDNEACMFATAFYGVLDTQTGVLSYANAGHCAPLWLHRRGSLDTPGEGKQALALGLSEDNDLQLQTLTLEPGDRFLLFTDGVIEAFNETNQEYGIKRTITSAQLHAAKPVKEWVDCLVDDVKAFMGNAPQSDDLTLLAFEFVGPSAQKAAVP